MEVKPTTLGPRCHGTGAPHDAEAPMTPETHDPQTADEKFDDEHYPAYTMGRAADMLGTTQGFLRSLDEAGR